MAGNFSFEVFSCKKFAKGKTRQKITDYPRGQDCALKTARPPRLGRRTPDCAQYFEEGQQNNKKTRAHRV
jgi:hypothetical protein